MISTEWLHSIFTESRTQSLDLDILEQRLLCACKHSLNPIQPPLLVLITDLPITRMNAFLRTISLECLSC